MRPIKLTISAFGPYANKQIIDFEELKGRNIFVISGKTGAGKTTIFDAISYALYGEASGESRETDSLRSHFAEEDVETYIELDFDLRGERYTVKRVPRQKKKKVRGDGYTEKNADATLDLPNGKILTSVNKVNKKVEELLGINRDQFKQIVMLAQGEFKKLLLAKSDDREVIFRKIFNTYDFEKIQSELNERTKNLSKKRTKSKEKMQTNLEGIKGNHDITIEEYVDFVFVIEKLKELIHKNTDEYEKLKEEDKVILNSLQSKEKERVSIKNNNDLLVEKENIIKKFEELLLKENEFKTKKEDLNKSKKAKDVKYIEDKINDNKNKLKLREIDFNKSLENIEKLKEKSKASLESLQLEENNEKNRDKLKLEIDNYSKIEPKVLEFDDLKNKYKEFNAEVNKIKLEIKENKVLIENLKKDKIKNENTLKEIAKLETNKVILENEIENKEKLIKETRTLYKYITNYENGLKDHTKEANEYKEFEKEYSKIKSTYETMDDLYKKEQAGILASQLREDIPCPVCGSTDHPNPATINNNKYVPSEDELKKAKAKLEEIEKTNTKKLNDLAVLNTNNKSNLKHVNEYLEKLSMYLDIPKEYFKEISEIVKNKGIDFKNEIEKLLKELNILKDKISCKEKVNSTIEEIEKITNESERKLSLLEISEKEYLSKCTEICTKIEEYKKDIPSNITHIKILKELLNEKSKELNSSIKKLEIAKKENDKVSKQLQGEISTSQEINKNIDDLKLEIKNTTIDFENKIKTQGFENINEYQSAKEIISKIEILENEIKKYDEDFNLAKSKKEEILTKTKDIVNIDLSTINEEINTIKSSKEEMEIKLRELYSILENNKTILENVESLNKEFKEIEEEYKVVGELSDLANGKKSPYISFERYVLASYFEDIIDAANIRLEKMTGDRFSLIRKKSKSKGAGQKGLELEIYDNYTDTSRDVSSLSGGESFKASLSLALGLSDVVQSNAGGVSLDTMFVDEGFGTLDPQSLDNAIDSLLELQRGGRLVGIISHVEELKERIDAKLEVVSTSKGSKAEFSIL
ncbi:MAG: SbcC/MukB-like Walker B domain-containing protein [Peptostreptococcaceae bacterium]